MADTSWASTLSRIFWPWDSIPEVLTASWLLPTVCRDLPTFTHMHAIRTSTFHKRITQPTTHSSVSDSDDLASGYHVPEQNKSPQTVKQMWWSQTEWMIHTHSRLSEVLCSYTGTTYSHGNQTSAGNRVQHNDLSGCLSVPVSVSQLSTSGRLTSQRNTLLCCESAGEAPLRQGPFIPGDNNDQMYRDFPPDSFNLEQLSFYC